MTDVQVMVTGMGCICGAGENLPQIMENLYHVQRFPAPPTVFETELETPRPVFMVPDCLEPARKRVRRRWNQKELQAGRDPNRTNLMALTAAEEAREQAGWKLEDLQRKRVGVALGTTVGCTLNHGPFYRAWRKYQNPDIGPVRRYMQNNPADWLADCWQLEGPCITIANACSSGADAIGLAKLWLESDLCDIAIAGGADELSNITYVGFSALQITAPSPCKPFDKNRTGLNLGEGAGILVLEKAEEATARGQAALGKLAGFGSHLDAYHPTAPHPKGLGLRRALDQSLSQAGITRQAIGFCNAHGTSTPENDKAEGRTLADCFGEDFPVTSTKSFTGHTLGAAGGIEAVFTVQALRDQKLTATAGFQEADPECIIRPPRQTLPLSARYGISNSLAFGGSNAVLLFQKTEQGDQP